MARENRYLSAFKEGGNLVGIATAVALSAAVLNPLPLLAGLVVEAAYLLVVPDSKWYSSRLSKKHDAEIERRRQAIKARILPLLEPAVENRYLGLEQIRKQLDSAAQSNDTWFRDVLRKLDYLLEKFLVFAEKDLEFRRYLSSVWDRECGNARRQPVRKESEGNTPSNARTSRMVAEVQNAYAAAIEDLRKDFDQETDLNSKGILEKRIDVLKQRTEGIAKIGRILTNLEHQMGLLEDTFGLINDQIRARSPEQVLSDIESVIYQTDSMTQLLEEFGSYDSSESN